MTIPTFLGIGAPRAGTTWLNTLLAGHPDVYVPTLRDEIRFFDQYYERGLGWYEGLFCPPEDADRYRAIGEISPQYLECEECPRRIFAALPEVQLIVIFRHPVNRAYSQYGFFVQRRNFRGSFEEFVAARPRSLERGFYSRYLKRYLRCFERSRFLALVFETAFTDIEKTKWTIAKFLGIDADKFSPSAGRGKVNPSSVPMFRSLSGFVAKTGVQLRRWHMEPIVDLVMRTNIQRILMKGDPLPPLDDGLKRRLSRMYQGEIDELEQLMQLDLSCWRK
jgi:Sulfotransferase domain